MEDTRTSVSSKESQKAPGPERDIDEALRKFQLQTGINAGSPLISFMRLAMKASTPASDPRRNPRGQATTPASPQQPEQPPVSYKPIEPVSNTWVLIMTATAILGGLLYYLARAVPLTSRIL
jgi:hypothetical protein